MAQWLSWLERRPVTAKVEHLPYKQRVTGSSPVGPTMDGFPSGQRGQTVNLLR